MKFRILIRLVDWLYGPPYVRLVRQRARRAIRKMERGMRKMRRLQYTPPMHGRRSPPRTQYVRFHRDALVDQYGTLYLRPNLSRLPHGVTTHDLQDEAIVAFFNDYLGVGQTRPGGDAREHVGGIRCGYLGGRRFCYEIPLGGNRFPEIYPINKFDWETARNVLTGKQPRRAEPPELAVPVGVDGEGHCMFLDLAEAHHVLIGGETGGGKTTLLHSWLTTLVERNTVGYFEMWLADPKRTELSLYKGLRSTRERSGFVRHIVVENAEILETLIKLSDEMTRRQQAQERVGAVNAGHYHEITGEWQPYIICVVEELSGLMLSKEKSNDKKYTIRSRAEELINRVASQGRSSHIILVLITQHPSSDVITGLIKANMPVRIALNCADQFKSIVVIGKGDAAGLPKGRAIVQTKEGALVEVQAPLITPGQINLVLDRIVRYGPQGGLGEDKRMAMAVKEMIQLITLARDYTDGKMSEREIMAAIKRSGEQIGRDRYRELCKLMEEKLIVTRIGGKRTRVVAPVFLKNPDLVTAIFVPPAVQNDARTDDPHGARALPENDLTARGTTNPRGAHQDGTAPPDEPRDEPRDAPGNPPDNPPPEFLSALEQIEALQQRFGNLLDDAESQDT